MTLKPKLSRGPKYSGGVPSLRMLKSGKPLPLNLLSGAPGQAGTSRPSSPIVTIQSGSAGV